MRAWVCSIAAVLAGCGGSGPGVDSQPTASASAPAQVLNIPTRGTYSDFATAKSVEVRTAAEFIAAVRLGAVTVTVVAGEYVIGPVQIASNTILKLEPGVTLRDSGKLGPTEQLLSVRGENVKIIGHGASIVANRKDYTSGEFRHGVLIFGAHNVSVEGLESSGHGGDGYYIGGASGYPSTDISITGCLADNNRRQGLSIVNAQRVYVADCEFSHTNGAAPEAGIDLEPNNPIDVLQDIVIVRPQTEANRGGGIVVFLPALGPGGRAVNIDIYSHESRGERKAFRSEGIRQLDLIKVDGKLVR